MARPWKMHASAGPASLAPMVRLGTLPLRLLALERGAALVYSEEIVDTKLAQAIRTVHAQSGTVEWRLPSGAVLLSTCAAERGRLVVQLGSSCAEAALAAARSLIDPAQPDRDGIVRLGGVEPLACTRCAPHECAPPWAGRHRREHGMRQAEHDGARRGLRALRRPRARRARAPCTARLPAHAPRSLVQGAPVRRGSTRHRRAVRSRLQSLAPHPHPNSHPNPRASRCAALADAGASRLAIHARRAHDAARSPARWRELPTICRALAARGCEAVVNGDALDGRAAAALRRAAGCAAVLVGRGALLAGTRVFGEAEREARGAR